MAWHLDGEAYCLMASKTTYGRGEAHATFPLKGTLDIL